MKPLRGITTISLVVIILILSANTRLGFAQALIDVPALDGFSTAGADAERRWEEQFRAVPASASAREHLRRLTLEPHVAGTKEDYATAIYVRDQQIGQNASHGKVRSVLKPLQQPIYRKLIFEHCNGAIERGWVCKASAADSRLFYR